MRRIIGRAKRKACPTRKVRFRDHESAVRALRQTRDRGADKLPVRAYECNLCHGWHLTSQARST